MTRFIKMIQKLPQTSQPVTTNKCEIHTSKCEF